MPAVFFRIIKGPSPTPEDLTSLLALGVAVRTDDADSLRLHSGISVYAAEQQARNRARDTPWLGQYLARLEIPDGAPVRAERTLRSRGHHTLWAEPAILLGFVTAIIPV
jgi:hypothetical protein